MRVLIVDDHPNTATMLARAVAQLGKQVEARSATSGREALKVADDFAADLLITDMIMPEMNGLELAEKLQNHPGGRPAHVILITAYDVPGLKETARRAKVDEILLKPVRPERICQIVENLLGEWNRSRPAAAQQAAGRPHRILVADDRPDNVTLLSRYLENEGYEYIAAADGVEALEQARRSHPDLVLLDVNMPKKDGFAVLEEMRADADLRHIPVIILTAARIDPSDVQAGFHLGADDYVTKPFALPELLARIKAALRRRRGDFGDGRIRFGEVEIDPRARRVTRAGAEVELTAREFDLLLLLVRARERALTREQILQRVWGEGYDGTDRTVDNFIARLRTKLEADPDSPQHIETVRGVGYRFRG